MYEMLVREISSSVVRVPKPVPGTAVKVTRYGAVLAFVISPEDYEAVEAMMDAYRNHPPIESELTDAELRAHAATDELETAEEYDYDGLAAALDA